MSVLDAECCSRELAIKLKDLGLKQKSIFYWVLGILVYHENIQFFNPELAYSAFTVAELGEMLPFDCISKKVMVESTLDISKTWWRCYFDPEGPDEYCMEVKEADARASMLIYLIEKEIINPNDWNIEHD